jgi:LysM repeat protein
MTNVTSTVAPMAPVPTVAQVPTALPQADGGQDFAKLVNQNLQASGQPPIPAQTLAQVLAPYATAMQTAAPQAPHAPEAAPLPNRVVDTAAPSYPAAPPMASTPTVTPTTLAPVTPPTAAVAPPAGAAAPVSAATSGFAPVTVPASATGAPIPAGYAPAAVPPHPAPAGAAPTLQPPSVPTGPVGGASPAIPALPQPVPGTPVAAAPATYTVQHGDSLSKIARQMGGNWHQLYEANRTTIGHNPNVIRPGQVLHLPATWQQAHAPHVAHVQAPHHVAHAPAQVAVAPEPPVEVPTPMPVDEAPNVESVTASPMMEKPADAHEAQEQIERMSMVKNGGADAISTMQDALKMLPKDSPDYEHFRQTVNAYEASNGAAKLETPEETYGPTPVSAAPQQPAGGGAPIASLPVNRDELPEDPDGPPVGFY